MNRHASLLSLACLAVSTAAFAQNTYPWPSTGNVGIGTTGPLTTLHVQGSQGIYSASPTTPSSPIGGSLYLGDSNFENSGYYNSAPGLSAVYNPTSQSGAGALAFYVYTGGANSRTEAMRILPFGNVGIGTTSPVQLLEVNGNAQVDGSLQLGSSGVQITSSGIVFPNGGGTQSAAWTGTICGGDFAESVNVSGNRKRYEPGDVLVIDPSHAGGFIKSSDPYSTAVLGVYSTKPGVVGRRLTTPKDPDEVPMAMVGIVPTKVSAENGPIHPGDLLVTSSTPGYAMKGTDRPRMLGAVIGKALGNLEAGAGTIEAGIVLQ